MDNSQLRRDVGSFFDAFVIAFRSFKGGHIAERYIAPYLTLRADGSSQFFIEHSAISEYFQGVVDSYHAQGGRSCRYKELEVQPLGKDCALGTVTWELLREDGSVLTSWRESYNLLRVQGEFRVFASVDHAG